MQQTHYYGDRVRTLLITVGVIMIVTLPFFENLIPKPSFFSILAALLLVLLAGLISPTQKFLMGITTIVSAGAFIAFEYHALIAFQAMGLSSPFFLVNEVLAILCLTATYFGTKSVRGMSQA